MLGDVPGLVHLQNSAASREPTLSLSLSLFMPAIKFSTQTLSSLTHTCHVMYTFTHTASHSTIFKSKEHYWTLSLSLSPSLSPSLSLPLSLPLPPSLLTPFVSPSPPLSPHSLPPSPSLSIQCKRQSRRVSDHVNPFHTTMFTSCHGTNADACRQKQLADNLEGLRMWVWPLIT